MFFKNRNPINNTTYNFGDSRFLYLSSEIHDKRYTSLSQHGTHFHHGFIIHMNIHDILFLPILMECNV